MPTLTISFNLPEESSEMRDAINGTNYSLIISDLDQHLRQVVKYGAAVDRKHGESTEAEQDTCDKIRTLLRELAEENGVNWTDIET